MPVAIYTPLTHRDFKRVAHNTKWNLPHKMFLTDFRNKHSFKVIILRINCTRVCVVRAENNNTLRIITDDNKMLSKKAFCELLGSRVYPNATVSQIQIEHAYNNKDYSQVLSMVQRKTPLENPSILLCTNSSRAVVNEIHKLTSTTYFNSKC